MPPWEAADSERSGAGPRPPGGEVVLSRRRPAPVPQPGRRGSEESDDRLPELPERVRGRRAEVAVRPGGRRDVVPRDEGEHDEDGEVHDDGRSLGSAWLAFVIQILGAAVGGLGVWLAFQELWRRLPYGAAGAAGLTLIAMLIGGHFIHKRRHPDEPLDLVTVAVLLVVGLVLTVSPAAFVLRPL